jgi:hypothetical protein
MATGEQGKSPIPSISRQKTFIIDNAAVLDVNAQMSILRIVMLEVGKTITVAGTDGNAESRPVILESGRGKRPAIHLDNLENPEVILHIYNIVNNRRDALNVPAN